METFSHGTLAPWYVTGFCDGEASFTYSRSNNQIAMYFAIKLSATDRAIVERIQAYFGVGRLYDVKARSPKNENSGFTKTAVMYRVTRRDELGVVTDHFDRYPLQSAKRTVYELWKGMVELRRDYGGHKDLLEDLAIELSEAVPRNQRWR